MRRLHALALAGACMQLAAGTSIKMDFLTMAVVRTDPIVNRSGLANHMHTFFGANRASPSTTYADLRSSTGNSGNVEENKSIYWFPTIYRHHADTGLYTIANTYLNSAYYVWETGQTTAFPNGFRMIAGGYAGEKSQSECVGPGACPGGDCSTLNNFFPATSCAELEMQLRFPSCWDGTSLDSSNHRSHVAYYDDVHEQCPGTHPVRIPEVHVFMRIKPYPGGHHLFSDGTGYFHSDYFSGWDATFLQNVLDECDNYSDAPNPDAFCENYLTYRDTPKRQRDDAQIVSLLTPLQPNPPFDTTTITTEQKDNVYILPGNPMRVPTNQPTAQPGSAPTPAPTRFPTAFPTATPTAAPTVASWSVTVTLNMNIAGVSVAFTSQMYAQIATTLGIAQSVFELQFNPGSVLMDVIFIRASAQESPRALATRWAARNATQANADLALPPGTVAGISSAAPTGGGAGEDSTSADSDDAVVIGVVVVVVLVSLAGAIWLYRRLCRRLEKSKRKHRRNMSSIQLSSGAVVDRRQFTAASSVQGRIAALEANQGTSVSAHDTEVFISPRNGVKTRKAPAFAVQKKVRLPPGWSIEYTDRGEPYYWNANTGESQWEAPQGKGGYNTVV